MIRVRGLFTGLGDVGGRQNSKQNRAASCIKIPNVRGTSFCALGVIEQCLSKYVALAVLQKAYEQN